MSPQSGDLIEIKLGLQAASRKEPHGLRAGSRDRRLCVPLIPIWPHRANPTRGEELSNEGVLRSDIEIKSFDHVADSQTPRPVGFKTICPLTLGRKSHIVRIAPRRAADNDAPGLATTRRGTARHDRLDQ